MCCIPFALYDVALGDVVRARPEDTRKYVVKEVVKSSGRYVFRVWFGESFQPRGDIAHGLEVLGALTDGRRGTCSRSMRVTVRAHR